MKFKKILKNQKGIAIVNALLFMMIIFSLCALLTTLTLLGHYQTEINKTILKYDRELDQIGEDFLTWFKQSTGENFTDDHTYENYKCDVEANSLTVKYKSDDSVALYVEIGSDDITGQLTFKVWRYSPHPNQTQTE